MPPAPSIEPRAFRSPGPPLTIEMDPEVPEELQPLFEQPLRAALAGRRGHYTAHVGPGRNRDEILVVLTCACRPPLPLYFPRVRARQVDGADVTRIVRNVLEGMGPAYPTC